MGNLITPGILDEKESKIDLFKVRIKRIVYSSKLIRQQTQVTVQRRNNNDNKPNEHHIKTRAIG